MCSSSHAFDEQNVREPSPRRTSARQSTWAPSEVQMARLGMGAARQEQASCCLVIHHGYEYVSWPRLAIQSR